jgi:tetratricopeptide (TPR) repeat protein
MMSNPAELAMPAPAEKTDRTLLAIVVLAAISLAGTIALLPSSEEKAAGLVAEGRYQDAISLLVDLDGERGLNAYEGFMLARLYVLAGERDKATVVLEEEAASQAENSWALRQLADLYRQSRNFGGEASALRRLYDANASNELFDRLRVLYRLTGDAENEASLIEHAIGAGNTSPGLADRLTYLQSVTQLGSRSTVWASGSGHFAGLADVTPVPDLMLSGIAPQSTTVVIE